MAENIETKHALEFESPEAGLDVQRRLRLVDGSLATITTLIAAMHRDDKEIAALRTSTRELLASMQAG